MTPAQRKSFENGIWLCRICGNTVDSGVDSGEAEARYPAKELRRWKEGAEKYVEKLHTQDTRLRQLRMIAAELLSTVRYLTAVPGPGNDLDQTFRTAGLIPVSRLLIEVEQTLFENDFQSEADIVRGLQDHIIQVEGLMRRKPTGVWLDISAWKNCAVRSLMANVMQFSPDSYDRYLARECTMVNQRLREIPTQQILRCSAELRIDSDQD